MKDFLNRLLKEAPRGANITHASLLLIVGGYFIYMGIQMIRNTNSGASAMPVSTSAVLCAVMCLIGACIIAYSGLIYYHAGRKGRDADETMETTDRDAEEQKESDAEEQKDSDAEKQKESDADEQKDSDT